MPTRATTPRPISPVTRSPTSTRARVTRCTTARTSVLDLDQGLRRAALFFEAQRDAVAQLAARVQPRVEQVPFLDVTERLEHRLLDAGVLALEVEDQALDALPLQAQIAARRTAAADDRQGAFLGVEPRLVLADVGQRTNDDVLAVVGDQLCRHRLQRAG